MNGSAVLDAPRVHHELCPNSPGWLRGRCDHRNERWIRLSCKRRDCPVCGVLRKRRIAYRVAYGLQQLGHGAWFVGTWDWNIPKKEALKTQQKFMTWLRRDEGFKVEYAATWEVTSKGRLHLNLILAPWRFVDQRTLSHKWVTFGGGMVVWIERVNESITPEVTKTYSKLGNYIAKFEQQVKEGRAICYSRGWPKPPEDPLQRRGNIYWSWLDRGYDDAEKFEEDVDAGLAPEVAPGEYEVLHNDPCRCFDFTLTTKPQKIPPVHYEKRGTRGLSTN